MAKKSYTNTLWFVSHSYRKPPKKDCKRDICLWNRNNKHQRKLIESLKATVIDVNNIAHSNKQMNFIGEWECCSQFKMNGRKGTFDKTHTPIHSVYDKSILDCHNTDPYVFGKEFYWICCEQPQVYTRIKIGDIVLFGSYTMSKNKLDKMLIDTVIVVNEIIMAQDVDFSRFSQCYKDVTIAHTKIIKYIVIGKMFNQNKCFEDNVPFSFVPCRREGLMEKLIFDRCINIPELAGNPFRIGQRGGHLEISDNLGAWEEIVTLVRNAGCELGVFMPEPSMTKNNSIINKHAKSIISKQKENEKDTTSCGSNCSGSHC